MTSYTIASDEGANFVATTTGEPAEVGLEVELKLDTEQEQALVAAGWLEESKTTTKTKGAKT